MTPLPEDPLRWGTPAQTPTTSWSGTRRAFPARLRALILQRDPVCVHCHAATSTIADHITPHHLCLQRGIDPDTLDNGQGLCHTCHRTKTLEEIRQARHINRPARHRDKEAHPALIQKDL